MISLKPGPNGGLDVPEEAYVLMFDLTDRFELIATGESLRIKNTDGSRPLFTDDERERIVRWKPHLLAMLAYVPPDL